MLSNAKNRCRLIFSHWSFSKETKEAIRWLIIVVFWCLVALTGTVLIYLIEASL